METIKVLDPRVNLMADSEKNHVVLQGGSRLTSQVNTADSYSSSQALFSFQPPSVETITDRNMKLKCYVQFDAVGGNFDIGTSDAPRQMPLASMMENLQVTINGESISTPIGDYIHALLCYHNEASDRDRAYSESCGMPDAYQNLNDWTVYGSARCPLKSYGENSIEATRGGFPSQVISPSSVRYELEEPLFISPFLSGVNVQDEGFVNVNQFNISIRWKTDLSVGWSHSASGAPLTGINVSFYQAPELITTYITPDYLEKIPESVSYPYHKSQEYIKPVGSLAPGASIQVIGDSIKLNQVPRKMYLFARRSRSSSNYSTADSFAAISNINLNWNNQSGLLATSNQQELYNISKRNGCNLNYSQFKQYRGAPFCCEFGIDVGLPDDEAPGCLGQYTFQVQATISNPSLADTIDYEFYTLIVLEGSMVISPNSARTSLGNLTPALVLSAKGSHELDYANYSDLQGGSFLSGLKHFVNKISRGVQSVAGVASKVLPFTPFAELAPIASQVQNVAGQVRGATGGRLVGAGGLVGGRVMRRGRR